MNPVPVVVQTAWLGDALLSLPLLRAAARLTGRPALLVTRPPLLPLFQGDLAVEAVLPFDKHGRDSGPAGLLAAARRLRSALAGRPAVALHPQGSVRSLLLTRLAALSPSIAFDTAPGRLLADHAVARLPHRPWDELQLLTPLGGPPRPDPAGPLLLRRAPPQNLRVALCVGSARPTKRPSTATLGALARRLHAIRAEVLLMGSAAERPLAEAVARRCGHACVDLTGQPLTEAAQTLSTCALAIGGDSGLLHLAQAVGANVVALHGPTPARPFERRLSPLQGRRLAFSRGLPCQPCSHNGPPSCPLRHRDCLHLRPRDEERVWRLVTHLLHLRGLSTPVDIM
ncbi:MAG: hypothetical protein CMH57_09635 [Myxococcales bacterium]|nr:hypothetical protein [Myxococcales bacterium]